MNFITEEEGQRLNRRAQKRLPSVIDYYYTLREGRLYRVTVYEPFVPPAKDMTSRYHHSDLGKPAYTRWWTNSMF